MRFLRVLISVAAVIAVAVCILGVDCIAAAGI